MFGLCDDIGPLGLFLQKLTPAPPPSPVSCSFRRLLLAVTTAFMTGTLGPMQFISMGSGGLMLMYTPTGSFLFDRLMAATCTEGTTSFLIFLSDGLGYFAVMGVLFAKTFGASDSVDVQAIPDASNELDGDVYSPDDGMGGSEESSTGTRIDSMFIKMTYGLTMATIVLLVPTAVWLAGRLPKVQQNRGSSGVRDTSNGAGAGRADVSISSRVEALELDVLSSCGT